MSEDKPDIEMPAFIRSMLEPYRIPSGPLEKSKFIEQTFVPPEFRPTKNQLEAIGRVTSTWAILEHVLEMIVARLAMTPQFPALALTSEMRVENRIKAMKALVELHRGRYGYQVVPPHILTELDKMPRRITALKDERNPIAHLVLYRLNDAELTGHRPRAHLPKAKTDNTITVERMNEVSDQIQILSDDLFILLQAIPESDEALRIQSFSKLDDGSGTDIA